MSGSEFPVCWGYSLAHPGQAGPRKSQEFPSPRGSQLLVMRVHMCLSLQGHRVGEQRTEAPNWQILVQGYTTLTVGNLV